MTVQDTTTAAPGSKSTMDAAEDAARDVKNEALHAAKDLRDAAIEETRNGEEHAKDGFADEVSSVGSALRRASDELRQGSPQERTFGYAANSLADLSDVVRDKDIAEIVEDISGFARRNPFAFLGGAALLGFAGIRAARASQRSPSNASSAVSEPYGQGGTS